MVVKSGTRDPLRAVTDGEGGHPDQEPTFRQQMSVLWSVSRPTLLLAVSIWLVFAWEVYQRVWVNDPDSAFAGALNAQAITEGRWWTLFTAMFLHAGIVHISLNSSMLVALGLTVGGYLGQSLRAGAKLLALYLISGVIGGLTFVAFHSASNTPMVGASGAICGLWGGAVRLREGRPGLAPLISTQVRDGTWRFVIANAVVVLPVMLFQLTLYNFRFGIAWEAHLGGYATGLLLIEVMTPDRKPGDAGPHRR